MMPPIKADAYTKRTNRNLERVRFLEFLDNYNEQIDEFPKNLNYLVLNQNYNQQINNLPDSIIQVRICDLEQKNLVNKKYHGLVVVSDD